MDRSVPHPRSVNRGLGGLAASGSWTQGEAGSLVERSASRPARLDRLLPVDLVLAVNGANTSTRHTSVCQSPAAVLVGSSPTSISR